MGRPPKALAKSEKDYAEALLASAGVYTLAAKALGVGRQAVAEHVNKSPYLQKILADAQETNLDVAETSLMNAVRQCQPWAVCFFLKCKGKGRGYVERTEVTGMDGAPIQAQISAVRSMTDEQLERIAELANKRLIGAGGNTGTEGAQGDTVSPQ
jgi:hypothetical protein